MRHKAIHVLHMPAIFKFLYDFAKERLSPKMATRAKVSITVIFSSSNFAIKKVLIVFHTFKRCENVKKKINILIINFFPKVHSSVQQLKQHIDPQCLPKEYGGTIPMAEMIGKKFKVLRECYSPQESL